MAKIALARRSRERNVRTRFLPIAERLEPRTVLSVCGVTCLLDDGVLQVDGTSADDLIALRYDADGGLVKVVGVNEEPVGEFPLSAVESLHVNGLHGDDTIEIDGRLLLNTNVNGGEGEDVLAAGLFATSGHSHGSASAARIRSANVEQLLVSPPSSTLAALAAPMIQLLSINEDTTAPATIAVEHEAHSAAAGYAMLTVHSDHAASSSAPNLAALPSSPTHSHAVLLLTSATAGASLATGGTALESSAVEFDHAVETHQSSSTSGESGELTSKFAPKRCTAKFTSKEVNRDVSGERQCDCPEKAAAAAESSRRAAADEALTAPTMLAGVLSLADCLPCQWPASVAAEMAGEVCSLVLPLEEHSGGCPDRASAAHGADAGAFYQGLQLVGLTLLGTSLVAIPSHRKKASATADDDDFEPAADWLFCRLWVERLNW